MKIVSQQQLDPLKIQIQVKQVQKGKFPERRNSRYT